MACGRDLHGLLLQVLNDHPGLCKFLYNQKSQISVSWSPGHCQPWLMGGKPQILFQIEELKERLVSVEERLAKAKESTHHDMVKEELDRIHQEVRLLVEESHGARSFTRPKDHSILFLLK